MFAVLSVSDRRAWLRACLLSSALGLGFAAAGFAAPAWAQQTAPFPEAAPMRFAIPAQPLSSALTRFADMAGLQLLFPSELVSGLSSPGVDGTLSPDAALARLLAGTGLAHRFTGSRTVTIERQAAANLLPAVTAEGSSVPRTAAIGNLPADYAGGQVARGGRAGVLGNQDMMDMPFSMNSYTAETVRNQQAESIGDVVANDPSVRAGYGYGNFSELFVIRGFPLAGEDVSIDGLYGNAPRQIVGTEMYERVEVLKGASAFLNGLPPGNTGTGGTVNLVPKRADDVPLTRFTGSLAQQDRVGGHLDIGRRFGRDDAFGIRANAALRDGETAVEDEERYYHMGSLSFDYRGADTRLTVDGGTQRQRIDQGRPVVFVTGPSVPDAPSADSNYATGYSYSDLEDTFVQAGVEHDIAPSWTAHLQAGYRTMREDGDYASPTVTDTAGNATVSRLTVPREDENFSAQAGLRGEFATGGVGHKLSVGAASLHTINRNSFEFGATSPTNIYDPLPVARPATTLASGSFTDLPKVSETSLRSVFVADTVSFYDERVLLTLGLRGQNVHVEGYNRTTLAETTNYSESAVTPVVGLVVKPTSTVSLYANRIEGLAQGPTAPATSANSGEIFAPYKSTQYEIGGKLDLGSFGASAAVFQTTQPSGITDPGTNLFGVDGEQKNRGVELMLFGEPAAGLRLLGGVTFLDASLEQTAGGTNDGNDAVGVPSYQVNLGAEWDPAFLDRVTFSARVLHTASQYLNAANTLEVDDWSRLDVGARLTRTIEDREVAFRLNVENLTNEAYWASAQGGYLTQGNPLTVKFSVSVDF